MGRAVELPLKNGPGHYIVSEGGDAYLTREVFVVKDGAGKLVAGLVCTRDADGKAIPWAADSTTAFILYEDIDATEKGAKRTFTVRHAEVQRSKLAFAGSLTDANKAAAYGQLAASAITLR